MQNYILVIYWFLLVPLSAYVFTVSLSRIKLMSPKTHKYAWSFLYLLTSCFSAIMFGSSLSFRHEHWTGMIALVSLALQLYLTDKDWKKHPPEDTELGSLV